MVFATVLFVHVKNLKGGKMLNKILFFCFVVCFSSVSAMQWHSWENPPKENQLYMYSIVNEQQNDQTLIIRRFDPKEPIFQHMERGWWSVNKDTVWWLMHQESKVIYLP